MADPYADGLNRLIARRPGEGIGIARIHQNRPTAGRGLSLQLVLTVAHGGRSRGRRGEDARDRRSGGNFGQHHVGAVLVFDARLCRGKADAINGGQFGKFGRQGRGQRSLGTIHLRLQLGDPGDQVLFFRTLRRIGSLLFPVFAHRTIPPADQSGGSVQDRFRLRSG